MNKTIVYLTNWTNDINFEDIIMSYNSKFIMPKNSIVLSDITGFKGYDFIALNIPSKYLKQVSDYKAKVTRKIHVDSNVIHLIYKYNIRFKKYIEYTLQEFYDKEIKRIKKNIEDNMTVGEKIFYDNIFSGKVTDITLYRTMGKKEYNKLIRNKNIYGKMQKLPKSGSCGKKVVCFFDKNMRNMNENYPSLDAYKIVSFKAKVSQLTLSFGRYDYEDGERWRYEWTIDKYNLKKFQLVKIKEFDIERIKECMNN